MSFEESLQEAVATAIAPLIAEIKELKSQVVNQYPPALTVKEAAKLMKCGETKMYELAKRPDFYPATWLSEKRVIISTNRLFRWIDENGNKSA